MVENIHRQAFLTVLLAEQDEYHHSYIAEQFNKAFMSQSIEFLVASLDSFKRVKFWELIDKGREDECWARENS